MKELIDILVCTICKGDLERKKMFFVCNRCKIAYPILDGIPDMLKEDAWDIEKAKKHGFMHTLKF